MKTIILFLAAIVMSGSSVFAISGNVHPGKTMVSSDARKGGTEFMVTFQTKNGVLVRVFGTVDDFWGHGSAVIHVILPDGTVIDDFVLFSGHTPDDRLAELFQAYEGFEEAFWQAVDGASGGN